VTQGGKVTDANSVRGALIFALCVQFRYDLERHYDRNSTMKDWKSVDVPFMLRLTDGGHCGRLDSCEKCHESQPRLS
jgi:hypothetical protein